MLTFSVNQDINDVVRQGGIADARPTNEYGRQWWGEAWLKALDDRTDETINLDAYGFACERNTATSNGKRETALLTAEEVGDGLRGVASTVASYIDINVDMIVESSEISTFIAEFKTVNEDMMIEEGVNLWVVMTQARQMITPSVDRLRELVSAYDIGSTIQGVLSNPECVAVLGAEYDANVFN